MGATRAAHSIIAGVIDFRLSLVSRERDLASLVTRLAAAPAIALDIETINWWDRRRERIALVQLAFREQGGLRVAIVDALAAVDLDGLRPVLEAPATIKAIHNAAYDAVRLARHHRMQTAPVHDTMLAARRGGERRYSLRAQAEAHLGTTLDKGEQGSDWSRRPLSPRQLHYAGMDAACTLLLYEHQLTRGLGGAYRLRDAPSQTQEALPLDAASSSSSSPPVRAEPPVVSGTQPSPRSELPPPALALLGVATEMAGRYSPERLAASADGARVGLAGWIIDSAIGAEADIDEETARLAIIELCERGLVEIDPARRLAATDAGAQVWRRAKPG